MPKCVKCGKQISSKKMCKTCFKKMRSKAMKQRWQAKMGKRIKINKLKTELAKQSGLASPGRKLGFCACGKLTTGKFCLVCWKKKRKEEFEQRKKMWDNKAKKSYDWHRYYTTIESAQEKYRKNWQKENFKRRKIDDRIQHRRNLALKNYYKWKSSREGAFDGAQFGKEDYWYYHARGNILSKADYSRTQALRAGLV